jgi:hypothetical protein
MRTLVHSGFHAWRAPSAATANVNAVLLLAALALTACDGGDSSRHSPTTTPTASATQTPIPTGTSTPSATASPRSTITITYRLTEGSTILVVPPTPVPSPTGREALSGAFTVVCSEPPPPNTVFQFTVTSIDLQAPSGLAVTSGQAGPFGCNGETGLGCMNAITIDERVFFSAAVSINGEPVTLDGAALLESGSGLPALNNLEVCGTRAGRSLDCQAIRNGTTSGYDLLIFAVPV